MQSGAMWRSVSCALCLLLSAGLSLRAAAEEPDAEVKTEVLFKPEECSQRSKRGDLINAHYDGYLAKDGAQFYCSRSDKEGHPQWFVLGVGQVIKGLDIGMMDMCPGEKRKITVPSALAFGEKGKGGDTSLSHQGGLHQEGQTLPNYQFGFICCGDPFGRIRGSSRRYTECRRSSSWTTAEIYDKIHRSRLGLFIRNGVSGRVAVKKPLLRKGNS